MRRTVADALSLMMILNVPATVGLVTLSTPIVRLIFERGAFTAAETTATAAALQFYALGLIGYSVVRIASPAFYALNESRIPATVTIVTVLVNAAFNLILVRVLGYRGLALGTSLAALLNAGLLVVFLRRRLGGLDDRRVTATFLKISVCAILMGAAAAAVEARLTERLPGNALSFQVVRLGTAIGIGLGVLAASAHLLHVDEFRQGMSFIAARFSRRRS